MKSRALAASLAACCLVVLARPAFADRVVLKDGRVLEGKVISRDENGVKIKLKFGIQTIAPEEVASVEIVESPLEEFERRYKESRGDAQKLFELGKWADSKDLTAQARSAYAACLDADKSHEGAHAALGHVKYEGEWVSREERLRRIKRKDEAEAAKRAPSAEPATPEPKAEPKDEPKPAGPGTTERPQPGPAPVPLGPDGEPLHKREKTWMDDTSDGVDQMYTIETAHYLIKTNVKKEYGKRYAKLMEALADRYMKVFRFAGNDFKYKKNDLLLYNGQKQFMEGEQQSPGVGGFYEPWSKRIVTFHGTWEGTNGTTLGTLAHEATHQFENLVLRQMDHAPIFMIEGLATFFEATEIRDDGEVIVGKIPGDRLRDVKRGIKANDYIHLRELIRTPHAGFTGYHYAHAWALIHWMLYGPDHEKAQKLLDWYWALCLERPTKAEDFEEGLRQIGYSLDKLEQAWKDWILELDPAKDPAVALYQQKTGRKK
jgi:hypothetical protein